MSGTTAFSHHIGGLLFSAAAVTGGVVMPIIDELLTRKRKIDDGDVTEKDEDGQQAHPNKRIRRDDSPENYIAIQTSAQAAADSFGETAASLQAVADSFSASSPPSSSSINSPLSNGAPSDQAVTASTEASLDNNGVEADVAAASSSLLLPRSPSAPHVEDAPSGAAKANGVARGVSNMNNIEPESSVGQGRGAARGDDEGRGSDRGEYEAHNDGPNSQSGSGTMAISGGGLEEVEFNGDGGWNNAGEDASNEVEGRIPTPDAIVEVEEGGEEGSGGNAVAEESRYSLRSQRRKADNGAEEEVGATSALDDEATEGSGLLLLGGKSTSGRLVVGQSISNAAAPRRSGRDRSKKSNSVYEEAMIAMDNKASSEGDDEGKGDGSQHTGTKTSGETPSDYDVEENQGLKSSSRATASNIVKGRQSQHRRSSRLEQSKGDVFGVNIEVGASEGDQELYRFQSTLSDAQILSGNFPCDGFKCQHSACFIWIDPDDPDDPNTLLYSCFDCSMEDYGGLPPMKALDDGTREAMIQKCTRHNSLSVR